MTAIFMIPWVAADMAYYNRGDVVVNYFCSPAAYPLALSIIYGNCAPGLYPTKSRVGYLITLYGGC